MLEAFDQHLATIWPSGTPAKLKEAGDYSLLAGGKRLRPLFALTSCQAVCGRYEPALPFACALEMIHTYSLIHDDLPAMDNDDFRRGRPTNHKVYGDGLAILAGDALLTEAFAVAARADLPPATVALQIRELAGAAGAAGMVGGQVLDIEATGKRPSEAELVQIHRLKTGALFAAAVMGGAAAGEARPSTIAALRQFAFDVGLAFQIIDDVLDVTQDLATLGKPPGSDLAAGKTTYVDLLGLDEATRRAHTMLDRGLAALQGEGPAFDGLRALARRLIERNH